MASGLGYFVVNVPDAVRGKAFYRAVLGWEAEAGEDPGRYYHIQGSSPAGGINGGAMRPTVDAYFTVVDAMVAAKRIRELGGTSTEPMESASGWSAECSDDQGGEFRIWQPAPGYAADGAPKCGEGDLFYSVLATKDGEVAQAFYGELFGWRFTAGSHAQGWNIENTQPAAGLFGAGRPGPISAYFRVGDVDAAAARVRAAGGTAGETTPNSDGWHADCRDDQGLAFSIAASRAGR